MERAKTASVIYNSSIVYTNRSSNDQNTLPRMRETIDKMLVLSGWGMCLRKHRKSQELNLFVPLALGTNQDLTPGLGPGTIRRGHHAVA